MDQRAASPRGPDQATMITILLIEPNDEHRHQLETTLAQDGYRLLTAGTMRGGLAQARRARPHAIVASVDLSGRDGLSAIRRLQKLHRGRPLIVLASSADPSSVVEAMRQGPTDVLVAPVSGATLLAKTRLAVETASAEGAIGAPSRLRAEMLRLGILGRSRQMLALFESIKRVAPLASTVLVLGESGTGKELVARALHTLGPRSAGPFVPINCANLSEAILESELFGHERGAFTSAESAKVGVMESAHRGTLFLDEVNELSLGAQAKLLRALERREFRRVGGTRKIQSDFHVVAASNVDLEEWVHTGRFRLDLFYRLNVVSLEVPPLRDRQDAVVPLARFFLEECGQQIGRPAKRLSPEVIPLLERYRWTGNVRELKNLMHQLTYMVAGPIIEVNHLPASLRSSTTEDIVLKVGMRMEEIEREVIRRYVGNYPTLKDAAAALGIGLRTLHEKLRRYGLRRPRS
jgi:DNA-binding NtrC family response regulator